MSREHTKAVHYIQLLDEARCDGNWEAVPELVRKIRKHAPERTCLALTAESEFAVTQAVQARSLVARPPSTRPSTATSVRPPNVSRYIPLLLDAIEKEKRYAEDGFQALVCLGWVHWELGEPALAASRLPRSIDDEFSGLIETNNASTEWTKICALKASYIKGNSQARTGAVAPALKTFESTLPIFSRVWSIPKTGKELRSWTELYLTGFCMVSRVAIKLKVSSLLEIDTLTAFRAWAKFWESQSSTPPGGRALQADVSRCEVWKEYYHTISDLLQQELPFPPTSPTNAFTEASVRLQQRMELTLVESRYEAALFSELHFPKAEEKSQEVEDFVEAVMQNWRVLCGSSWQEPGLEDGGAEAMSKGVLEILYRAAAKTFHSTVILRHLFTVHLAIAEFDVAFKAFDTYLEIIKKGKARIEKTGCPEHGLDDDGTVMETTSECIKALCRYGSRQGAEKAKDIAEFLEHWINKFDSGERQNGSERVLENGNSRDLGPTIAPRVFAMAWRCIGIAHAQWARLTYDASSRADIQLRAIKCFRKALLPKYESSSDIETLFALGIILAERRELARAIEVVKTGLLPPHASSSTVSAVGNQQTGRFARERSLIPLWHLLSLLLSSRQEFVTASRSCEGAFEQFQDPKNLFGAVNLHGPYRSDHLNEKSTSRELGVIDFMNELERENVLEVKMTQLALIELLEGPEVAVNASDELLSLYARLFGDPRKDMVAIALVNPPGTAVTAPPRSSAGTIRSIRGSIFGRSHRSSRKSYPPTTFVDDKATTESKTQTMRPSTSAPAIHVTNENGNTAEEGQQALEVGHEHYHEKLQKRSASLSRKKSSGSSRNRSTSASRARSASGTTGSKLHIATAVDDVKSVTPDADIKHRDNSAGEGQRASHVGLAISRENTLPADSPANDTPQASPPEQVRPKSRKGTPLKADELHPEVARDDRLQKMRLYPSRPNPVPRLSKDCERRRRMAVLIKVWLLISGFYRRAIMYDDARGAIEEAHKTVQNMEIDISKDASGDVSIDHSGWGGGKSVRELWGDVFSERANLALAESSPYVALSHFESALTHFADHPAAIVGLSNILLDLYTEKLLPPTALTSSVLPGHLNSTSTSVFINSTQSSTPISSETPASVKLFNLPSVRRGPLGIHSTKSNPIAKHSSHESSSASDVAPSGTESSHKEPSTAMLDRLASRDRAYGLLSRLTKLGTGWNYSEAWFALARAYEESGQVDKAKDLLWWCVELEEGKAIRDWGVVGVGGYVL